MTQPVVDLSQRARHLAVTALFGVCIAVAGFALGTTTQAQRGSGYADQGNGVGNGDGDRSMIAVTGTYGSGASVLYVIDTRSKHMSVYRTDNGRKIELVGARDLTWDFKLEDYNDQSPAGMMPGELRRSWEEAQKHPGAVARPAAESRAGIAPAGH